MHILCFPENYRILLQFFYGMVVICSLSMVGDGGGCWEGVGRALGGRREGVWRALGGRWRVVRVRPGSLIYRQIKSLHCSGYLLVIYIIIFCLCQNTHTFLAITLYHL